MLQQAGKERRCSLSNGGGGGDGPAFPLSTRETKRIVLCVTYQK
jgi:hypothetical protein